MSLIDEIWRQTSGRLSARTALYVEPQGEALTFQAIEERVDARARSLPATDLLVPCASGNTASFIVEFLAARRAHKVFVPFDRSTTPAMRRDVLHSLEDRALPTGTAMIKLTSGSTAQPRGIALAESHLIAGAENIMASMDITGEDVHLGAISLAHSYGFDNLVLPLVLRGSPVALLETFYPGLAVGTIARCKVTFVPLVPVMYDSLLSLDGDWSSVRCCISAGTPLSPELAAAFHARTQRKIHTFYGSSECGGITFDRSQAPALPPGCVGTPLEGVGVDLTGEGLVRVRSGAVGLGYIPEDATGALAGGSFISGDLGRFDERGQLILTGRAADVINVAGRKVAPAEIESCLLALQGVIAAAAVGVPDPRRGESVGALAVAPGLEESLVLAHCRSALEAWKVPKVLRIVDGLPYDERGKLSRIRVRKLLLNEPTA